MWTPLRRNRIARRVASGRRAASTFSLRGYEPERFDCTLFLYARTASKFAVPTGGRVERAFALVEVARSVGRVTVSRPHATRDNRQPAGGIDAVVHSTSQARERFLDDRAGEHGARRHTIATTSEAFLGHRRIEGRRPAPDEERRAPGEAHNEQPLHAAKVVGEQTALQQPSETPRACLSRSLAGEGVGGRG